MGKHKKTWKNIEKHEEPPNYLGCENPLFQSIGANKEFMWCHMDWQDVFHRWPITIPTKRPCPRFQPRTMERWILYYNNLYTTLYVYIYIYIIFRISNNNHNNNSSSSSSIVVLLWLQYYYYDNHVCEWPKWQLRLRLLGSCVTWRDAIGCLDSRGYWLGFLYILYTYR